MPQKMTKKAPRKIQAASVQKKSAAKKPVAKTTVKKTAPKSAVASLKQKAQLKSKPVSKPVQQKKAATKTAMPKVAEKAPVASRPVGQAQPSHKQVPAKTAIQKTPGSAKALYKVGVHVVYPTHGVGKIVAEETQMIGDIELRMLVIAFDKDKMTLRVPVHRATAAGLRPVSSLDQMKKVFVTLKSRARTSRGMWSRRAQEYEAKINSGNIFYIAEVVRDLHQNVDQSERSYSERMIYESALSRLVGELAAAESIDAKAATDKLMKLLRAKVAAAAAAVKEAA